MGVDVNLDKVCLMMCKTMLSLCLRHGLKVNTADFQSWLQYWQDDYPTLRYRKILITNSSEPKTNFYLAGIMLKYFAMIRIKLPNRRAFLNPDTADSWIKIIFGCIYLRHVLSAVHQIYFDISDIFMKCCWLDIRSNPLPHIIMCSPLGVKTKWWCILW